MKIRRVPAHRLDAPKQTGRRSAGSRVNSSSGRTHDRKGPSRRGKGDDQDRESHPREPEDRAASGNLAGAISA
jgi:hypothetical protein